MYLKPTNPNTMMDFTPISADETDILGRFADRLSRTDNVITRDAGTTWTLDFLNPRGWPGDNVWKNGVPG